MSNFTKATLIAVFIFGIQIKANAISVESETTVGTSSIDEAISVDGKISVVDDRNSSDSKEGYPWYLSISQTRSKSTDVDGNTITDITNAVSALYGYESAKKFEVGAGLSYTSTPAENLISAAPNVYIGFGFEEEEKLKPTVKSDESSASDFKKSVGFKLSFTNNRYIETFATTQLPKNRLGLPRPTTGKLELVQNSLMLEVPMRFLSWLRVRPSATYYRYNSDVNDFLNNLNSARLTSGTTGLKSTATSLPSFDAALQLAFYMFHSWELTLSESYSIIAKDKSNSWSSKVQVFDNIGDWRIGLGYSSLNSASSNDSSGTLIVSYDF